MRVCVLLLIAGAALAQQPDKLAKRYGYEVSPALYPQKDPKEALASVVKAILNKRVDYLVAHLAEPEFVDKRVADYAKDLTGGEDSKTLLAFDRLVKETAAHFAGDPVQVRELAEFAKDAEWEAAGDKATGKLKTIPTRRVYMKKIQDRWFLENKQK